MIKLTYATLPYQTKIAFDAISYNSIYEDLLNNPKMLYSILKYQYNMMTPQIEEELFCYIFGDDLE